MSTQEHTVDLHALATDLAADVESHTSGRAARSIVHGSRLRSVVMALAEGRDLADHTAPGPAVLQVLQGELDLRWEGNSVPLAAGELHSIPEEIHSVHARTRCVFMLTICLPG